jgi:ABC-type Fe3+-hydroxamate transport system substrate-binding protein
MRTLSRRTALRVGLLGGGAALLAACQSAPQAGSKTGGSATAKAGPVTIKHAVGEFTLPTPATRVASLQFQFLEALLALDVMPTAQADEQQPGGLPNLPEQIDAAVKAKNWKWTSLGNRVKPNLEVLATSKVEFIIGDLQEHGGESFAALNKIAPTMIQDTNSYAALLPNLDLIAQALGVQDRAAPIKKEVQDAIATAKSKAKQGATPPRVLVAVLTPDRFFAYGANSFQAGMVKDLGATYVYKELAGPSEQISLEALPELNADVIIGTAFPNEKNVLDVWAGNPIWDNLAAVKAKRVHAVSRNVWALGRGVISIRQMVAQATPFLYPA